VSIRDDNELRKAQEALGDLYRAVASLRKELLNSKPQAFAVLAEGPLQEIRRISQDIDEYAGISQAMTQSAQLWLRLRGESARWGETSASVLTAFLDAFRKGVQAIAAFNLIGRVTGRLPGEIQRTCDFELVAFQPGSFTVGMRLPESQQIDLIEITPAPAARTALSEYLSAARWIASSTPISILEHDFAEPAKRRIVLRSVKPLIPRIGGGIESLELSGRVVPNNEPILLTHELSKRVSQALKEAVGGHEEVHEGDIREMDLDAKTFKLRNLTEEGMREVPCRFAEDIGPLAASYLDKHVRVVGTRSLPTERLEVVDIESLVDQDKTDT
jgi:hypothetical protein